MAKMCRVDEVQVIELTFVDPFDKTIVNGTSISIQCDSVTCSLRYVIHINIEIMDESLETEFFHV
jgi:hypothetical protein